MADAADRQQQYKYKTNSNIVLLPDVRLIERQDRDEATGEVISLVGKLGGAKMGDRAQKTKPGNTEEKKENSRKRRAETQLHSTGSNILSEGTDDLVFVNYYKPKTQETRQTYEILLSFLQEDLGDEPRAILCGTADEVLVVLKNDRLNDREKKKETEQLIGTIAKERFALLVNLCKKITDYEYNDTKANLMSEEDIEYGI